MANICFINGGSRVAWKKKRRGFVLLARCLGGLLFVLVAQTVNGAFMLSPVAVAGSDLGEYDATVPFTNMINHSGVDVPFVSGSTDFDTYFANPAKTFAQNGGGNNWQSEISYDLPFTGYVDFDLGTSYRLEKIAIWNVSVKDLTVTVFEDLNQPGEFAGNYTLVSHWNYPFSYAVDLLSFATNHHGRYVRLGINSVHPIVANLNFGYANIGEVVLSARPADAASPSLAIALNASGEVTITFTGKLHSASVPEGPFTEVPENPQAVHTIPKGGLAARQYFRSQSQ